MKLYTDEFINTGSSPDFGFAAALFSVGFGLSRGSSKGDAFGVVVAGETEESRAKGSVCQSVSTVSEPESVH